MFGTQHSHGSSLRGVGTSVSFFFMTNVIPTRWVSGRLGKFLPFLPLNAMLLQAPKSGVECAGIHVSARAGAALNEISGAIRAKRPARCLWCSPKIEVRRLLGQLRGVQWLVACLTVWIRVAGC